MRLPTAEMQRAREVLRGGRLRRLDSGMWGDNWKAPFHAITIQSLVNRGLAAYTRYEQIRSRANRPVEVRLA